MYDMTYETWTAASCAIRLPEAKWHYVDASGNSVTKSNMAGRLVKHRMTQPEWILHGDEVGTTVCKEDDEPIDNQLYLNINGQRVKRFCTNNGWR